MPAFEVHLKKVRPFHADKLQILRVRAYARRHSAAPTACLHLFDPRECQQSRHHSRQGIRFRSRKMDGISGIAPRNSCRQSLHDPWASVIGQKSRTWAVTGAVMISS